MTPNKRSDVSSAAGSQIPGQTDGSRMFKTLSSDQAKANTARETSRVGQGQVFSAEGRRSDY